MLENFAWNFKRLLGIANRKRKWQATMATTVIKTSELAFEKLLFDDYFTFWRQHVINRLIFWCSNMKHKQQNVQISHELLLLMALCFPIHLAFSLSFELMELLSVCFENGAFHFVDVQIFATNKPIRCFFFSSVFFSFVEKKTFSRQVIQCFVWFVFFFVHFMWFSLIIELPCGFHWSTINANLRFIFISLFDRVLNLADANQFKKMKLAQCLMALQTQTFRSISQSCSFSMQMQVDTLIYVLLLCKIFIVLSSLLWVAFDASERLVCFRDLQVEFSIDISRSMCVPF